MIITSPSPPQTPSVRPVAPPEVVAGIVNDGSAAVVAQAAVRLARELGGRVRFVQVLPDGLDDHERADAEAATFGAALRALHGRPRVQATFEAPPGDARELLVRRSRLAMALVVGQDKPGEGAQHGVAAYCQANSGCRVLVVPAPDGR
ncbi:universal stress protein [Nostocoides sp. HKS02]|uniref:universal stress protein n=1 Tax=Nostocoides sp. HKS02 TaxID=1813880 RepID=UPI0012B4D11A|nr:universal stress protein [Tetrasphaera sp. HKS02]QGN56810.1 hypothetical protein GKE56_01595 [Tetrasphaera sp. HKS02]